MNRINRAKRAKQKAKRLEFKRIARREGRAEGRRNYLAYDGAKRGYFGTLRQSVLEKIEHLLPESLKPKE